MLPWKKPGMDFPRASGGKAGGMVSQWVDDNLDEEEKQHYMGYVRDRFRKGKLALPLDLLETVAAKKDHVFPSHKALVDWVGEQGWGDELGQKVIDKSPPPNKWPRTP